jgi:hypothetical protein
MKRRRRNEWALALFASLDSVPGNAVAFDELAARSMPIQTAPNTQKKNNSEIMKRIRVGAIV